MDGCEPEGAERRLFATTMTTNNDSNNKNNEQHEFWAAFFLHKELSTHVQYLHHELEKKLTFTSCHLRRFNHWSSIVDFGNGPAQDSGCIGYFVGAEDVLIMKVLIVHVFL